MCAFLLVCGIGEELRRLFVQLLLPILKQHFGIDVKLEIVKRGFFPKGGGIVNLTTDSNRLQGRNHVSETLSRSWFINALLDTAMHTDGEAGSQSASDRGAPVAIS